MQANQTHKPSSKSPRPRGSERLKIVLAVILAGVLGGMLLPSSDASSDSGLEPNLGETEATNPVTPNRLRNASNNGQRSRRQVGSSNRPAGRRTTAANAPAEEDQVIDPEAIEPARRSTVRLPSIDLATIAAHDPFSLPADKLPNLAARNDQQTDATKADQQLIASPSQMRDVRAVYATSEGGAALVDGRVVPVSEPQKLMRAMRTD